jgi:hypothetical protein
MKQFAFLFIVCFVTSMGLRLAMKSWLRGVYDISVIDVVGAIVLSGVLAWLLLKVQSYQSKND